MAASHVKEFRISVSSEGLFWVSWASVPKNTRNALKSNWHWKSRRYNAIFCAVRLRKYTKRPLWHQILCDFGPNQTCRDGNNSTYLLRQVRVLITISTGSFDGNGMKFGR